MASSEVRGTRAETRCAVCGERGAAHTCGECRATVYCSRRCQTFDWTHGRHARVCGTAHVVGIGAALDGRLSTGNGGRRGALGVSVRRAGGNLGTYRVAELIVDVVTAERLEPKPLRAKSGTRFAWSLIRRPPLSAIDALYWRATVDGATGGNFRVLLGQLGDTQAVSAENRAAVRDYDSQDALVQVENRDSAFTVPAPAGNDATVYFITEVRYTHSTDAPAVLRGGTFVPDTRFSRRLTARAREGYTLWENTKVTLREGVLGSTGSTVTDPDAPTGRFGLPGTGNRALRTATRRPDAEQRRLPT